VSELPPNWARCPLGNLLRPDRPKVLPPSRPDLPFVGMENVEAHTMRLLGTVPSAKMKSSAVHFQPGDVLYGRLRPYLNKVHLPAFEGLCSAEFIVLPPSPALDSRYVSYLLNTTDFVRFASHLDEGDRPRVDFEQIASYLLPLAPLPEQHRIVAEIEKQFTRFDAAVAALRRAAARLKQYRAALLETETTATRWARKPLAAVADIQGGIQKQPQRAPAKNAFPFLRVANVRRGALDLADVHQIELFDGELDRLRLQAGDLLIVEGNGSPNEIGRMAIWDGSITDCVHQNHIIRARLHAEVAPAFAAAFWNSPSGSSAVKAVASSTSGLHTLSVRKVGLLEIPVPPLRQQEMIVEDLERKLSLVDDLGTQVEVGLARAKRLRQSILKRAFEGKLVPQDPTDEPAFALRARTGAEGPRTPDLKSFRVHST
jgi:type I restriction enzyme S subunit